MIFFSDNGGQNLISYGGGNNYPLRGGKGSQWEGGSRGAAFVSGGALPAAARGTEQQGLVHGADWLATLCGLAGFDAAYCVEDAGAAAAGLPPMDSLDVWPLVSGANATSPRTGFPLSATAYVTARWKLILGQPDHAGWTGPLWPNASSPEKDVVPIVADCREGCLYDVAADPGEHLDVAAANPGVVAQLKGALAEAAKTFYTNNETADCLVPGRSVAHECACKAGAEAGGFFVPWGRNARTQR